MFTIYGKPNCPWCDKAKATLDHKGYAFKYIELKSSKEIEEFQKKFPSAKSVPQILWYDKWIGGAEQLDDFIKTI